MNCLDFVDRLAGLVAGACTGAERDEAERHAAGCPDCAELLRAARARRRGAAFDASPDAGAEDDELVASVLARTSGSACARAESLLCDYVDGELASDDRELVAAHLEHCAPCSRLAEALGEASAWLPRLAEFDPGPAFVRDVLAATSRAEARTPAAWERLVAVWQRALARPRFAFEVAYVATLVLLLVVGNPAARLQAASARTITVAAAGIERAKADAVTAFSARASSSPLLRAAGRAVSGIGAASASIGLGADFWQAVGQRVAWTWSWLRGTLSSVADALAEGWTQLRAAAGRWLSALTEPRQQPARSPDQKVAGMQRLDPGATSKKS